MGRIKGLAILGAVIIAVSLAGAFADVAYVLRHGDAGAGVLAGLLQAIVIYGDLLVVRTVRAAADLDKADAVRTAWIGELAGWYAMRPYADPAAAAAAGQVRAAADDLARLDACLGVDKATGEDYASMLAAFVEILDEHPGQASTLDAAYHTMQSRLAAGLPVSGEFHFDADGDIIEGDQC